MFIFLTSSHCKLRANTEGTHKTSSYFARKYTGSIIRRRPTKTPTRLGSNAVVHRDGFPASMMTVEEENETEQDAETPRDLNSRSSRRTSSVSTASNIEALMRSESLAFPGWDQKESVDPDQQLEEETDQDMEDQPVATEKRKTVQFVMV